MFTKKVFTLFTLALFVLISAASEIDAQTVKAKIEVKDIHVDATSQQVDTGIKIMPGDTIKITATGATHHGANVNWTLAGDPEKDYPGGNFAFKKANPFALVGWIGSTPKEKNENHFQVSRTPSYKAEKGGNLHLAINDWSGHHYNNNGGGLIANVVVERQYKIYAEGTNAKAAWGEPLVMINNGDGFSIDASGTVAYWEGGDQRGPDGKAGSTNTLLAPNVNESALIAKLGDNGGAFKIGKKYYQPNMNQSGWLYLTVNDQIQKSGAYSNNSGNLNVYIAVRHSKKQFKNPVE